MSFRLEEIRVLDIGRARFKEYPAGMLETSTPISRVHVVESFPAVLNWRLAVCIAAERRSTIACDAHVVDPAGRQLSPAHLKFVAEPGSSREEILLPVFTATGRGTYCVRLYLNASSAPAATQDILVDIAASLA